MQDILGAGFRLRKWRKSIPMKSFELARLIGISQGSLSDIENDKSNPSAPTIVKLLKKTNINVYWMLTGIEDGEIKEGKITEDVAPMVVTMNAQNKKVLIKYDE